MFDSCNIIKNQGEAEELFQTEGNHTDGTAKYNTQFWSGSFSYKDIIGTTGEIWGLRIRWQQCITGNSDFDGCNLIMWENTP